VRITARYTFDAAHRLRDSALDNAENDRVYGPCSRIHGHTYRLEVSLRGDALIHGMLIDFGRVDAVVNERIIDRLDHRVINEVAELAGNTTTAEDIAQWIWSELDGVFAEDGVTLDEVTLCEGVRFSATVSRNDFHE
jgi:6-pyruvoyltetrahydropterin/6-carboxytetrahydropterin synthase